MADGGRKRLNWEWEEIVLACDLVVQNGGRSLDHEDARVVELSNLLQRMTLHPLEKRLPEFRNPNGVAQKTRNIAQHHPAYTGGPSNGNVLDGKVMERFVIVPDVMHAMAECIRASIANGEPPDFPREVGYDNESEIEGRYLLRWHAYRERSGSLRAKKINSVLAGGGSLTCEVCGFDFASKYGERGQGYIECHHVESLSDGGEKARSINDLALLCSNCHRMVHTKLPWPTPGELKEIIDRLANGQHSLRLENYRRCGARVLAQERALTARGFSGGDGLSALYHLAVAFALACRGEPRLSQLRIGGARSGQSLACAMNSSGSA